VYGTGGRRVTDTSTRTRTEGEAGTEKMAGPRTRSTHLTIITLFEQNIF
jgi:hypothetical protein